MKENREVVSIMKNLTSVVSYPDRGPWGDYRFRGNTSGHLIKDLIEHYQPKSVLDPCAGSGTTGDVCREHGIDCDEFDLSNGFNILSSPLPPKKYDMIFFHPPYWDIIKYSDNPHDFSNTKLFDDYMQKLFAAIKILAEYLSENGVLIILIGDVRKHGRYYPLGAYIQVFHRKEIRDKIIKVQHNVKSSTINYPCNIVRIMHEEVIILTGFPSLTWHELVLRTLKELGGISTLPQLYNALSRHPKTLTNSTFKATIRRTLQETAVHKERGAWSHPRIFQQKTLTET